MNASSLCARTEQFTRWYFTELFEVKPLGAAKVQAFRFKRGCTVASYISADPIVLPELTKYYTRSESLIIDGSQKVLLARYIQFASLKKASREDGGVFGAE